MKCHFQSVQFVLGYASSGGRFICLLVDGWSLLVCYSVEDGSFLPFFGVCGWNEMIETVKTKKGRLRSLELSFFICCSLGLLRS
jgi:hypothetical protein